MKRFYTLFAVALLAVIPLFAYADGLDLAVKNTKTFQTYPGPGTGDLMVIFDASDDEWKTTPAAQANSSDLTAVTALATTNCGATYYLNSATEFATTLPAPTSGCTLRFIVKAAPSGASYTILTASSANIFIGKVTSADLNAASDGDISTADDTITLTDAKAAVGDMIEFRSDGTSWYYIAFTGVFDGIVGTQAS